MPHYNVIQAAEYIGCDPKTVRRWLKRGKLTAERTERGWLAIPGGQVEYAKALWEEEQAKFKDGQSRDVQGNESSDYIDRLRRVEDIIIRQKDRIDSLSAKVATLERRVTELEAQPATHQKAEKPRVPVETAQNSQPSTKAQNRSVERSGDLPPGTLHWREFAAQIGIKPTILEGILRHGIRGEHLERIEVPTAKEGQTTKYFSKEQAEKAIEVLRRHGKM